MTFRVQRMMNAVPTLDRTATRRGSQGDEYQRFQRPVLSSSRRTALQCPDIPRC